MEDGSPCWKDFSNSRNNRFMTAEGTSKNRIVSPGKVLHFYNAPPDISNDQLNEVSQNTKMLFFYFARFTVESMSWAIVVYVWLSVFCSCGAEFERKGREGRGGEGWENYRFYRLH